MTTRKLQWPEGEVRANDPGLTASAR